MSIIDQIKEAPADSAIIAKFEGMARTGSLSGKQIAYGKALIASAVKAQIAQRAAIAETDAVKEGEWLDTIYGEALVSMVHTNIDGERTATLDLMTITAEGESQVRILVAQIADVLA